ncbi:Hypothetical protein R9X50_00270900 [Acrodontium crateriforme]|uniref:Sodium/calcium exchanger membrane region domain-containing protein n=1 Tax=Acrodontium crateriforme TaxID=150365 RepID=A0AAQ3M1S4_9PEZI|nr:Hypothetical protein R9X50_00270900 [Acrodontium crateriforme]
MSEHDHHSSRPRPTWHSGKVKMFKRKHVGPPPSVDPQNEQEKGHAQPVAGPQYDSDGHLINHNGHKVTKGIQPAGESGRSWMHPWHMLRICFRSSCTASKWTNILWPFTIAAMVMHFNFNENHLWVFICAYIGMVPAANLVGFAGQELARKMPLVIGVILETTLGSVVEVILFMVLVKDWKFAVIRAAILGSILANVLFCLGLCFFTGGIFHPQQTFHEAISEVGSNLMLVAAVGLVIPTIFYNSLAGSPIGTQAILERTTSISHATAIVLLIAFVVYVWFQARSHHGLYEDILEADEERDHDRHRDLIKDKLTLTEAILAVIIALTFVGFMAVFLVQEIDFIKDRGVSDAFLGLILVPIVEKAAEHLTAIDEAYDNQMNFALSHVLGASIQTALLNTPLVVLVSWGINTPDVSISGHEGPLALNFELFDAVMLILAIIVVGNFLRDEKSDYLEGALCVFVYILIAVSAWYYPNPSSSEGTSSAETGSSSEAVVSATEHAARMLLGL